jgi:glycerophosphoryl diester phosphodiesterase
VLNIAHRGASRDERENTLEAFRLAVRQAADMIETDLHHTADAEIVLHHDADLAGSQISELPFADLRERAPWVPTLAEALDAVGAELPFNLELKRRADRSEYAGLEARALHEVRKRGWLERTLFSSFFDPDLARLRELDPLSRLGLLISPRSTRQVVERASRLRAESVNLERSITTPELVAELREARFRVLVFTVDDPEDWRRLRDWGVDGVFTNVPGLLAQQAF